ncbi:N-formylglutamate deformylase (EC [alternative form] [Amycolatopsis camponoti]|uniref:N-formylglutamate deformylase n=1 Tax=Amycolatopsis camponoti TaxID=2606593 RepID=A0A6I8LQH5_9PSEU|nr:allantoate amidohydrolase [Amycolatopsis camponoti]VVJ19320.1 N-formylglutamate deformylase (EC [alternative form] [Amycolatopsis camponoti]
MTASGFLEEIGDVGRDAKRGGYSRHAFDSPEQDLRAWFGERALGLGLDVDTDHNGNIWAWWGPPGPDAVVTGSHLDSVPGGGAFDGPLGVVSALAAVERLRDKGSRPGKPLAVVVFAEEEGGRFGVPCLGSRLLTGTIDADRARGLRDADGVTFAEAAGNSGFNPALIGPDPERLGLIGKFLELHVEQGRGLIDLGAPVAVGSTVIAHGRWRFSFEGQGNHAGATLIDDRADPMLPAAATVTAVRRLARAVPDARATVGRLVPTPGGTNVIASTVDLWLDARVPGTVTPALVEDIKQAAEAAAKEEGCRVTVTRESYSDDVVFDDALRRDLADRLGTPPELPTGAGHDAAILAGFVPAGMLYVRNPTGISHSPEEFAEPGDVEAGATALTDVLGHLAR